MMVRGKPICTKRMNEGRLGEEGRLQRGAGAKGWWARKAAARPGRIALGYVEVWRWGGSGRGCPRRRASRSQCPEAGQQRPLWKGHLE